MGVLGSSQNKKVSYMSDERITNLEIKLSFTEDLIEKLNETVYKQQQQIEFLYRELKAIKEQASSSGGGSGSDSLKDEIPPHY
jgi:SlyX protein